MFTDHAFGKEFFNITHRVSGKAGDHEDVMLAGILLKFVFKYDPAMKIHKPFEGDYKLTGKPSEDLHKMIAAYQKFAMKRVKPEGFLNKAVGSSAQKVRHTICDLNFHVQGIIDLKRPELKDVRSLIRGTLEFLVNPPPPTVVINGASGTVTDVR